MPVYPQRGLHGHVVRVIGQQIVQGVLRPGDPLDVEAMEAQFGVSRTVVREALKVLAAKGLVDARPKRGTFVRPRADWSLLDPDLLHWQHEGWVNRDFLANLAELRAIVEPAAARLAAVRRDDGDLASMRAALDRMSDLSCGMDEAVAADVAFHRLLLASTHNELLERMEVVLDAGMKTRDRLVHERNEWQGSLPAHEAVFEAVRAGDPDRAESAMLALLEIASRDDAATRADRAARPVPLTPPPHRAEPAEPEKPREESGPVTPGG